MIGVLGWIKVNWLFLTFLALVASAFILLRSKPSNLASLEELKGVLSADQPAVVEFYSNF